MRALPAITFCLLWSLLAHAQFSAPHMIEELQILQTSGTAVADIDGDGTQDVVHVGTTYTGEAMSWQRGQGDGTFSPPIWFDDMWWPIGLTLLVGDVDTDGDNDVLILGDSIHCFRNNGDGAFPTPLVSADGGSSVQQALLDDVNGDGMLDIMAAGVDECYFFRGLGNGAFVTEQVLDPGNDHSDLALLDLDNDGDQDLLSSYPGIRWFANNGGMFSGPQTLANVSNYWGGPLLPSDLDGDADTDLIGWLSTGVHWWPNDGAGQFGTATLIAAGNSPTVIAAADMDGDGDVDVLPIEEDGYTLGWMENEGNGQSFSLRAFPQSTLEAPEFLDIDGDGFLDILDAPYYGPLSWIPCSGSGQFGTRRIIYARGDGFDHVEVRDLDGDNDPDVLALNQDHYGRVVSYLNDGSGAFGNQQVLIDTMDITWGFTTDFASFTTGDLDGDADQDIYFLNNEHSSMYVNDGAGHFSNGPPCPSGIGRKQVSADMDGDGDVDLVSWYDFNVSWHENDGAGDLTTHLNVADVNNYDGIKLADADLDGDLDILTRYNTLKLYRNDGPGGFAAAIDVGPLPFFDFNLDRMGSWVDLDGDNYPDLVYVTDVGLAWQRNVGGAFIAIEALTTEVGAPVMLITHDMDQNGHADLIYCLQDGILRLRLNSGDGNFDEPVEVGPLPGTSVSDLLGMWAADMDQDDDDDIVVAGRPTGDVHGLFWYASFLQSPYRMEGTAFVDANENGQLDTGEGGLPFIAAITSPAASIPLTDTTGHYRIFADSGYYEVHIPLPGPWWAITTDSVSYHVHLTDQQPVASALDFGYAPVIDSTDLHLTLVAGSAPCEGDLVHFLSIANEGTTLPSGTVCYALDSAFTFVSSVPPPTSISGDTICWEYDSLFYFSIETIQLNLIGPDAITLGNPISSTLTVTEEDELGNVLNTFQEEWNAQVQCAYDPNDKRVTPAGYGAMGAVDIDTPALEYTIRFQNTGNAPATDVVLRDPLDSSLDPASIQVVGFSHDPTSVSVDVNGQLVVRFENIQLVDSGTSYTASQGFFSFRIHLQPDLPDGTEIHNTASIFFDFNPPVITNTTQTMLVDCDLWSAGLITAPNWNVLLAPEGDAYQWYLDGLPLPGATDQLLFYSLNGDYTVSVTSALGCTALSEPMTVTTAGIPDGTAHSFAVFPNPFTGAGRIIFDRAISPIDRIELLDITGKVVRELRGSGSNEIPIERGTLSTGCYLLRLSTSGGIFTARLMVQ